MSSPCSLSFANWYLAPIRSELTVRPRVELELFRDCAPPVVVPRLDLRLVHRVRHQLLQDVGLQEKDLLIIKGYLFGSIH